MYHFAKTKHLVPYLAASIARAALGTDFRPHLLNSIDLEISYHCVAIFLSTCSAFTCKVPLFCFLQRVLSKQK